MTTKTEERQILRGMLDAPLPLLEQGNIIFKHANAHQTRLFEYGLPANWFEKTRSAIDEVFSARGIQVEAQVTAKGSTVEEGAARSELKRILRQTKTAAEIVLADGPVAGVDLSAFMTGPLGKSTTGVLDHAASLRRPVVALEEPLKPYFKGESPTATLDRAIANLSEASSNQGERRSNAPRETRALYLAKGKLLEQIELVNRIARIAFDGDASIRALFNKDVLLSARRGKKAEKPADPQNEIPGSD